MFIDASGAWLGLRRSYARAYRGKRAYGKAPRRKKGKVSLLAAVSLEGINPEQCLIHEGAVDTSSFLTYVQHVLVPTLRAGQVVFMDNFTIHHNSEVRRLIEAAGCYLVYLPSYSPDFNPIEMVFAKVKAWLKKVKPKAVDELIAAIGEAIAAVTPAEVRACFAHCGYL